MEVISKTRDWTKPAYSLSEDRTFNNSQEFEDYCEENGLVIGATRTHRRCSSNIRVFKYDKELKKVVEVTDALRG